MPRTLASAGLFAALLLAPAASAQDSQARDKASGPNPHASKWDPTNGPRPKEWGPGISEWNAPEHVYVTGDPLQLTKANMNSGKRISFVACPYVQDSDPTPLWFSDYEGQRYFLRAQQNMTAVVYEPDLGHKVLVEGIVSDEPKVGGGIVLNPLWLSVMPELDPTCNKILPADGSRISFAKRPPGPGSDGLSRAKLRTPALELAERMWAADYKPDPVVREEKTWTIYFGFEDDTVVQYPKMPPIIKYARDVEASSVEIVGHRAAIRLSNGEVLTERAGIERERAASVERIFNDFPFAKGVVKVSSVSEPNVPDGISDFSNRYVTIRITPGDQRQALAGKPR